MIISDLEAIQAVNYIRDNADLYAKHKSSRIQLEKFMNPKKGELMLECELTTQSAKEAYAYSHKDYKELINCFSESLRLEESIRWRMESARLRISVFQTQQAGIRVGS
jgi:hypothetical protein